jgi:hypothetical protein
MFTVKGMIKCIVGFVQSSLETFFRVNLCALWCRSLGSTSHTYIKKVTIAMRDIDSGRPNIALLTELDYVVSKGLKRHFFWRMSVRMLLYVWRLSRSSGKYELVVVKL